MTNQIVTPATKSQLDALIEVCLDGGHTEAAGLLQLGSDTLSQIVRDFDAKQAAAKDEAGFDEENKEAGCCCYEHQGDNQNCPIHGDNLTHDEEIKADHYSDYGADYKERNDLYCAGMGC